MRSRKRDQLELNFGNQVEPRNLTLPRYKRKKPCDHFADSEPTKGEAPDNSGATPGEPKPQT